MGNLILDARMDVLIYEEMLLDTDVRAKKTTLKGGANRASNPYLGFVGEAAFAKFYYGDHRMARSDRVAHRVDFPGIEVKASRRLDLTAAFLMSEIGAAKHVNTIVFAGCVINVNKGAPVKAGLICRFYGWMWGPIFIDHGLNHSTRYEDGHAVIQMERQSLRPIWELNVEMDAFKLEYLERTKQQYVDNERAPIWLRDFAMGRLGVADTADLFE